VLGWLVLLVLNVVAIVVIARTSQFAAAKKRLKRLTLGLFGALLLSTGLGVGIGVYSTFAATRADIDTTEKARMLGEGISEAMNCTAFGVASFTLPSLVALALFLRAPQP